MSDIVPIKGATTFTINLDPSVWIFDKRKIDLHSFIEQGEKKEVSEREIRGSYAIPFQPFLANAEPQAGATSILMHRQQGHPISVPFEEAMNGLLIFAKNGQPLKEDGPLHFMFAEKRDLNEAVTHITAFEVKE